MERPTVDITLPESGATVTLYEYLTNGENRALKRIALSGTKFKIIDGKPDKEQFVDTSFTIDMEDQALKFLIRSVLLNGQVVTDTTAFVNNLTAKDADLLYEKINAVTTASVLKDEDKKK